MPAADFRTLVLAIVADDAAATARLLSAAPELARDRTPLHRAVRTRCAAAVTALLDGGADPNRRNGTGSTPLQLATRTTGRGGSGSPQARGQQAEIVQALRRHGAGG